MLQYPFYKDLTVFAEANPDLIDLPVDNITDLMLKVTRLIYLVTVADLRSIGLESRLINWAVFKYLCNKTWKKVMGFTPKKKF